MITGLHLIRVIYIGLTILSLLAVSVYQISVSVQIILFAVFAIIAGLPHGGMDVDIARYFGWFETSARALCFFLIYLGIAGANFALWLIWPFAGLLFLLLLSIWHFGDDWVASIINGRKITRLIIRLIYGTAFITLPALNHEAMLQNIYAFLIPQSAANDLAALSHVVSFPVALLSGLIFVFFGCRRQWWLMISSATFIVSAVILPPVLFLLLYFCFFHGPKHTYELYIKLQYDNVAAFTKRQIVVLFATLLLLLCAYAVLYSGAANPITNIATAPVFSALIIFIACLTTPHMMLTFYFDKTYTEREMQ